MKARINKNKNNSARKMKVSSGLDINRLSLPDKIKFYQTWVEEDFYATVKMYENNEDVTSADILIEFMHDRYLDEFPKSARPYVMSKVSSMMNERLQLSIDDVIEIECAKRGVSKRNAVEQIKETDDFISCIFPDKDIPAYFKEKMQSTVNSYIKDFEEKYKDEQENIKVEPENDVEEPTIEENNERVAAENEEIVIETEPTDVATGDIENSEEHDESIENDEPEKSEEEKFIDSVMLFTNNYDFLSESIEVYRSRKGYKDNSMPIRTVVDDGTRSGKVVISHNPNPSIKFKSVDDATRFINIQNIVRKMMSNNINTEEQALNRIVSLVDDKDKKRKKGEDNNIRALRKARLENIFEELEIHKKNQEFIKSVLKPICTARLDVINRENQIDNEEIEM